MSDRHNDPQSPHERARLLASDQLDAALSPTDAAWLDGHLADCDACRAIARAFAEDRALLRTLPMPEPPRDLWARTSVALERERSSRRGLPTGRTDTWGRLPALGGILAVLIVGLLVGRSLLPDGGPAVGLATPGPSGGPGSSAVPGATPLAVPPGDVAWITRSAGGPYTMNVANVAAVCPQDAAPSSDCASIDAGAKRVASFLRKPGSVVLDPQAEQAAVVESSASSTGGSIFVVPIARPTPAPTASPSATPAATASTSATPPATTTPDPSPSLEPTASVEPTASAEPTPSTGSTPSPTGSPVPTGTPAPTAAATLAIIEDVVVVGGEAAYSPDGEWLAFSARPAQGTDGPDVYVWHIGDPTAHAVTSDHGSVFSAWVDGQVLASRADRAEVVVQDAAGSSDPAAAHAQPVSFLIDPASGKEHDLNGFAAWRPVVDPSGRWVIYWTGTLIFDPDARTWIPADGRLVIDRWNSVGRDPSSSADPKPLLPASAASVRDWEVRWDPSGRYLGAWVADPLSPGLGRLSLLVLNRQTGRIDLDHKPVLRDAPALPGFAIGDGRIAWATAPGQDGEGSRLLVLAWKGPDAGRVRSDPARSQEDIIVVH
ncbi:MAG: zf-HC2 domain-containing protein [Candidatus Limnocylindrales bacterium]